MSVLLATTSDALSWSPILIGLLGGLALFLFGMEQLTEALKAVAGAGLSKVLAKLTRNRFAGAFTGAFTTAVIQSSSVTTVLVVGFVTAGMMSLQQSVSVIMGANIGTTVTAQIIAFDIAEYALVMIAVGFAGRFVSKNKKIALYGSILMGLGLIFFGMGMMSDATRPLRSYEPFIDLMQRIDNPILGILVAALFTALVQSSSATTGIVIVLASQGFISLEAGIALAFGSNIGTCVTAALAAMGKPREAVQAAAVHLLFNIAGVLIWLPLIGVLVGVVQSISPTYLDLEGTARLAAETPRQIANAHTVFNVANTLIFIGFTGPIAWLVTKVLPDKPEAVSEIAKPRFLDDTLLSTPDLALDRIRLETIRLGQQVAELAAQAAPAFATGSQEEVEEAAKHFRQSQKLYDQINGYIRRLAAQNLTPQHSHRLNALTVVASQIEHLSDINAVNLSTVGIERHQANVTLGTETHQQLSAFASTVREAFDLSVRSLDDPALAHQVLAMKPRVKRHLTEVTEHLANRLASDEPNRRLLYRLETQAVEYIYREYSFAKKIAKQVIGEVQADPPAETEELPTQLRVRGGAYNHEK